MRCLSAGLDDAAVILAQIGRYKNDGYPLKHGLAECNVLVRRHSDARVSSAMRKWWTEIESGSRRDQISFNYVLWRAGLSYHELAGGGETVRTDRRFRYVPHATERQTEALF
jgi:hypothetical protein